MSLTLFDDIARRQLLPFTHTRPVADIRCGILTMRERWEKLLGISGSATLTEGYLQGVYPAGEAGGQLLVNGRVFATAELADAALRLEAGERLNAGDVTIAARISGEWPSFDEWDSLADSLRPQAYPGAVKMLQRPWDIFSANDEAIRADFNLLTSGRASAPVPEHVIVSGAAIFLEEGAVIQPGTVINANSGPVYIGRNAEIMEGCIIRGPLALCDGATMKMAAKIYGATTIGPGCKVGGEVNNVVFFANSNKGHDGFLGNAVIGEWCNLGADTNCSNLKNNYDEVKIWDEAAQKSVKTGLTFCGLLMGDHSKSGINTMFNTGTVAGVSCNIWGGGFPEKFIPSFSWGGPEGMSTYQFDRAMETAERMMIRRGRALGPGERAMLQHVFEMTAASRELLIHSS
jgi:UDP-N-acetylglucosamine diphosphorylase/glucosamine-1-phosphate N-acetyltransferase